MKKLLLICCIVLGVSSLSKAQGGGGQGGGRGGMNMKPEDRAAQLKTQLALTDDQTAKVTAIYVAQSKSMDSLRTAGGDMQAMRPMMMASNAKIKAILTPEQATKFDAMQQRRGGGGGGTPPPPRK